MTQNIQVSSARRRFTNTKKHKRNMTRKTQEQWPRGEGRESGRERHREGREKKEKRNTEGECGTETRIASGSNSD